MEAISRAERILTGEDLEPISREEHFLAKIAGKDVETPEPISRKEHFLQEIIDNGGSGGITPTGTIDITENGNYDVTNYANANVIVFNSESGGTDTRKLLEDWINAGGGFGGSTNLTELDTSDLNIDTSGKVPFAFMFANCRNLSNLNIPNISTNSANNMSWMFYCCSSLTNLDVSNFNTSRVTNMSHMFETCSASNLDVSNFNTSKVTDMSNMFTACSGLTSLDLSSFNTSIVTNMYGMFNGCRVLTTLNLSNFDTTKVTNMAYMFSGCSGLTSLDLSNFNTSKVTDMGSMFRRCNTLTTLDVSNFNTSNVIVMSNMFDTCGSITTLDLSSFNTKKVGKMINMFNKCTQLENIIGELDLIYCMNLNYMFRDCTNIQSFTLKNIKENLQIGSGTLYGHLLTLDTLINTIKELWNYSTYPTTYTLTIESANLEKIANTYVKLITPTEEQITADPNITSKLPCEVCESTDDGAMLIKDYALLKNWDIQ